MSGRTGEDPVAMRIFSPSLSLTLIAIYQKSSPLGLLFFVMDDFVLMPRLKGSTRPVYLWLEQAAFDALKAETARLSVRPGKFLSSLILERSASFHSRPVQLIDKK
jgi:hypothetical protein